MIRHPELAPWGWRSEFERHVPEGFRPARVLARHRASWVVHDGRFPQRAALRGAFLHDADPGTLPVTGDWVLLAADPGDTRIHGLLPRSGLLRRREPGSPPRAQALAAHVETALLVGALNGDFNLRRLERALAQVAAEGIRAVLVLTKADLCPDWQACLREARALGAAGALALSVREGWGLEGLEPFLRPGDTLALLGSSGAGKSTLLNALLGEARQSTGEVRQGDGRGRHTTTRRELFPLPGGALMIDTPGLREWQLWNASEGVGQAFADLDPAAAGCRFRDCTHTAEPGCAVLEAVAQGRVPAGRLESRRKLAREAAFQQSLEDRSLQQDRKAREKRLSRAIRSFKKH